MDIVLYQAKDQVASPLVDKKAGRSGDLRVGQAREFPLGSTRKKLLLLGNFLIALSVTGLIIYYWPLIKAEGSYVISSKLPTFTKATAGKQNSKLASFIYPDDNLNIIPQINQAQDKNNKSFTDIIKNTWQTDALAAINAPDSEFSVVIPKIGASARVIANVNAGNPKIYNEALRQGVAHAAGSVLPGMKGTTYLFAHSTDGPWNVRRYNAIFYLLKELEVGDEIVIFFEGKKYFYTVFQKEITSPTNNSIFKQKDDELLVLQTCWPPGTAKQALLVTAKRK